MTEQTMAHTGSLEISIEDRKNIELILTKVHQYRQHDDRVTVMALDLLRSLLTKGEVGLIDRVMGIEPIQYGFKAPQLEIEPIPQDLFRIDRQEYVYEGQKGYTEVQYIPQHTYRAYQTMAQALQKDLDRPLLIESSYRSDAYQVIVFLSILKANDFDVTKTAQRVAIPGYSEHSTPSRLALDLKNIDGLPSDKTPQDFEGTKEYEWLTQHAHEFHFFMSYPRDNKYGVMFEPWHWRHMPQ